MGIASICSRAVELSARLPAVAPGMDRSVARFAIAVVKIYQKCLSHRTGRTCLFSPSCSNRAISLLEHHGWSAGIRQVDAQLKRCVGNYTLCVTCSGDTILATHDGSRFAAEEISPVILGPNRRPAA